MSAHPTGRKKNARRLRTRALWLCLLAGLFVLSMATRPELREVLAQSSSPPAAHPLEVTSPAQNAGAQVDPAEPATQQNAHALPPAGPPRRQLADYSANLLKLANRVKAEVDSTTADTLSIAAIRDVQEIEKLAHKMRTQ